MKYYFITYQASERWGDSISVFNKVIATSPMRFVSELNSVKDENYKNFVVLNTCEISEKEYNEFKGYF